MVSLRAVLFDLDRTLYENDEDLEEWARIEAHRLFSPMQTEQLFRALPVFLERTAAISANGVIAPNPENAGSIISTLVPGLSERAVGFISTMYSNWLSTMALTPNASECLAALDSAGVPYGIVTNAPVFQLMKIAALGLDSRVKCAVVSGMFGAEKPDPSIVLYAVQSIGVPSDQVLFVGDSPHHDIVGAHRAGIRAAWLRRGRTWPAELEGQEPEFTIDSLLEVIGLVDSQ